MSSSNTHDFTMDPNLLVSVIKSQAGTLSKALVEGVMNSIDAGAKRVDITLDKEHFTIKDKGKGFSSRQDIELWFCRFGTPHTEQDAMFGRFRMGRGQMMAFAATTWRTGPFLMQVDIETTGLTYELQELPVPVEGCEIEGKLYQPLNDYKLSTVLAELKTFVAYAPRPVYVNGELYGAPAQRLKSWTFEDDHAYYRLTQDARELQVYNQGIFVEQMGAWRIGMGGVVVSKRPLLVNFARNSVMENSCLSWQRIARTIENKVLQKLLSAKKLSDTERQFLARHLTRLKELMGPSYAKAKLLTDPTGKHSALEELSKYKRFAYTAEITPRACALHGQDGTFVLTEAMLERFGTASVEEFLSLIKSIDVSLLPYDYTVTKIDELSAFEVNRVSMLDAAGLKAKKLAAYKALGVMNELLSNALLREELIGAKRMLLVGRHKNNRFSAWTDGKSYVTANEKSLKLFETGQNGILTWVHILIHEYTHDTDDSESHDHGEVFYRKFHDTLFIVGLGLAAIAQQGLIAYLQELKVLGVPQPHRLKRQLKGLPGNKALVSSSNPEILATGAGV